MEYLNNNNIYVIKQYWEDSITKQYSKNCAMIPCGQCDDCFSRFFQIVNIIKCSSGVSDKVVLQHWKHIYTSKKYKNYNLMDWIKMSEYDFAALCVSCSCWKKIVIS